MRKLQFLRNEITQVLGDNHIRIASDSQFHHVIIGFISQVGAPLEMYITPVGTCNEDFQKIEPTFKIQPCAMEYVFSGDHVAVFKKQ